MVFAGFSSFLTALSWVGTQELVFPHHQPLLLLQEAQHTFLPWSKWGAWTQWFASWLWAQCWIRCLSPSHHRWSHRRLWLSYTLSHAAWCSPALGGQHFPISLYRQRTPAVSHWFRPYWDAWTPISGRSLLICIRGGTKSMLPTHSVGGYLFICIYIYIYTQGGVLGSGVCRTFCIPRHG